MNQEIEKTVASCIDCQRYLPSQSEESLIPSISTKPMEILDSDLFEWNSKPHLLVVDRFSGFCWCERIPNQTTTAVLKVLKRIFREVGYPQIFYSDSGPAYASQEMEDFANSHGFRLEKSSARKPSSNAVAESNVKVVKRILQKSESYNQFLDALARYRNCPRATGESPSSIFFRRQLREPDLAALPPPLEMAPSDEKRLVAKLEKTEKMSSGKELSKLEPGQMVLIQDSESKIWRESGRILSIDNDFERSYWVQRIGRKKPIRRNRIFLRPLAADAVQKADSHCTPVAATQGQCKDSAPQTPPLRRSERVRAKAAHPNYKC